MSDVVYYSIIGVVFLVVWALSQKSDNINLRLKIDIAEVTNRYALNRDDNDFDKYKKLQAEFNEAKVRVHELEQSLPHQRRWKEADYTAFFGEQIGKILSHDTSSELGKARWRLKVLSCALDLIPEPKEKSPERYYPTFESKNPEQFCLFLESRINIRTEGKLRFIDYSKINRIEIREHSIIIQYTGGLSTMDDVPSAKNGKKMGINEYFDQTVPCEIRLIKSGFKIDAWEALCAQFAKINVPET
jgi:hypothetical protein